MNALIAQEMRHIGEAMPIPFEVVLAEGKRARHRRQHDHRAGRVRRRSHTRAGLGEQLAVGVGPVHDTLTELDVLTVTGEIVRCRPDNEHADLFYGFPNSYGTLGYALRLRARTSRGTGRGVRRMRWNFHGRFTVR